MASLNNSVNNLGNRIKNVASDLLEGGDFLSRTIGMSNSYEDLAYLTQALGYEPVSLLGKDFSFIFDHVRRNYKNGTVETGHYKTDCPKFNFYKKDDVPTVRFADFYNDSLSWYGPWIADMEFTELGQIQGSHVYAESYGDGTNQGNNQNKLAMSTYDGTANWQHTSFGELSTCDLLAKTNTNFRNGRYQTLIARFYTDTADSKVQNDPTQTAISAQYGMSHGRNLLKLEPDYSWDYKNPYCRVWTYHHEYRRVQDLIRPFNEGYKHGFKGIETAPYRTLKHEFYGFDDDGDSRLEKLGVLNYDNGHVRIAPTARISDYFNGTADRGSDRSGNKVFSPKSCMFSIENLAWRDADMDMTSFDAYGLSAEQKGPLGGRIMWFPPYNLQFSEMVTASWNPNEFIGRGEPIYTYKNTVRSGNLSFTMLIDHPSILNYLKDLRNGSGEGERTSSELGGLRDGVDDTGSMEQGILRFFAGCDYLTPIPQVYKYKVNRQPNVENKPENEGNNPNTDAVNETPNGRLVCFIYYPNNYSGVDDRNDNFAIDYLANGIGAQKMLESTGDRAINFQPHKNVRPTIEGKEGLYGGYEMSPNGISVVSSPVTNKNDFAATRRGEANLLTDGSAPGTPIVAKYGSMPYTLCKQVNPGTEKSLDSWYQKWYYRVDNEFACQILTYSSSTIDAQSFKLNGSGYMKVDTIDAKATFDIDVTDQNVNLVSFADLYVALEGDYVKDSAVNGEFSETNVELAREILTNKKEYKIVNISFHGNASRQGYSEENKNGEKVKGCDNVLDKKAANDRLAQNRAETFKQWLRSKGVDGADKAKATKRTQSSKDHPNVGSNSTLTTKIWRSAFVVIDYAKVGVEEAQVAEPDAKVNQVTVDNKETEIKGDYVPKEVQNNGDMSTEQATIQSGKQSHYPNYYDNKPSEEVPQEVSANTTPAPSETVATSNVKRYDNEGEFFQEVNKSDNFLRHKIKEKVKFFDPAFHSISPEGFSARLTFLHQCTRQGSTISNSAWESSTSYNLAFGRPPVCVLRVGDFYYTKIIITSLDISYGDMQWDLNPEGAGVIPMFADVKINFSFIGGSDLGGPIARLQNAVSFNYYANTSVYDNRAEMVKYDTNGSGNEVAFKPFIYPNTTSKKLGELKKDPGKDNPWSDI